MPGLCKLEAAKQKFQAVRQKTQPFLQCSNPRRGLTRVANDCSCKNAATGKRLAARRTWLIISATDGSAWQAQVKLSDEELTVAANLKLRGLLLRLAFFQRCRLLHRAGHRRFIQSSKAPRREEKTCCATAHATQDITGSIFLPDADNS